LSDSEVVSVPDSEADSGDKGASNGSIFRSSGSTGAGPSYQNRVGVRVRIEFQGCVCVRRGGMGHLPYYLYL